MDNFLILLRFWVLLGRIMAMWRNFVASRACYFLETMSTVGYTQSKSSL